MKKVLVTGSNGQLGMCLRKISDSFESISVEFMNSKRLDITKKDRVNSIIQSGSYDYCINCAAYTNVEQAERNPKMAFKVNAQGVENLALACLRNNVVLIHISTDYVFDGQKKDGYSTTDLPNPINQYGMSKLAGENYIKKILEKYFIIRTSWLYSEYGQNFYKTILNKAQTESSLFITDEQTGSPTNANNLAKYILNLIVFQNVKYGLYHFTDDKTMTWYDFTKIILKENKLEDKVKVEKAKNYGTFAERPKNSVLKNY